MRLEVAREDTGSKGNTSHDSPASGTDYEEVCIETAEGEGEEAGEE